LGFAVRYAAGRSAVEEALSAVGARELADRSLCDMSGGERQRLLLAQAFIGSPPVLLLDEPLISLDPHQQEIVIERIRRYGRDREATVLFSAHELNQLLGVLDRVLYLGGGQAALGTVDEVVTAPVLSRLYGAEIEVIHAEGHIFVMSNGRNVERADHLHEDLHSHPHLHSRHEHPSHA
jgi:zinc/manganese transport system ATP-binding protein